uniref:Chemosensory protein 16 n=1 Tax=Agrilus planipennis TaxID=224129 RepID=A0A890UPW0_AGRPL|nr:chemosensory protein 16 [Agrilus planipennis]
MAKIPCFLVVVALALHLTCAEYAKEFQDLDANKFVKDEPHISAILECLVNEACTGTDKKITESLVQAYRTHCSDCSPQVESKVRQIAIVFAGKHKEGWAKVVQKYDPKGERTEAFKKFIEKS